MADDIVAFLRARLRDLENAIETEIETGAPLYAFPEQLLADVASKRAILAEYEHVRMRGDDPAAEVAWRNAVMLLAEVYSEHPDWSREFKR